MMLPEVVVCQEARKIMLCLKTLKEYVAESDNNYGEERALPPHCKWVKPLTILLGWRLKGWASLILSQIFMILWVILVPYRNLLARLRSMSLSYRNQVVHLQCKSVQGFLVNFLIVLTLFFPMFPFDLPKVFWCFQGDQKGTLGRKGLD